VQPGQRIHESVFDTIDKGSGYFPKACLYGDLDWHTSEELRSALIEEDPYTKVSGILFEIQNSMFEIEDQRLDVLLTSVKSGKCWLYQSGLL
jgi:hypothetical protein